MNSEYKARVLHSNAPWVIETRECDGEVEIRGITSADGDDIITTDCGYYGPNMADAKLIVAGPELLAACRQALGWLNKIETDADGAIVKSFLEEVIKKAVYKK